MKFTVLSSDFGLQTVIKLYAYFYHATPIRRYSNLEETDFF